MWFAPKRRFYAIFTWENMIINNEILGLSKKHDKPNPLATRPKREPGATGKELVACILVRISTSDHTTIGPLVSYEKGGTSAINNVPAKVNCHTSVSKLMGFPVSPSNPVVLFADPTQIDRDFPEMCHPRILKKHKKKPSESLTFYNTAQLTTRINHPQIYRLYD